MTGDIVVMASRWQPWRRWWMMEQQWWIRRARRSPSPIAGSVQKQIQFDAEFAQAPQVLFQFVLRFQVHKSFARGDGTASAGHVKPREINLVNVGGEIRDHLDEALALIRFRQLVSDGKFHQDGSIFHGSSPAERLMELIGEFPLFFEMNHAGARAASRAFNRAPVIIHRREFVLQRLLDGLIETRFVFRACHKGIRLFGAAAETTRALGEVQLGPLEFAASDGDFHRLVLADGADGAFLHAHHAAVAQRGAAVERVGLERRVGEDRRQPLARAVFRGEEHLAVADFAQAGAERGDAQVDEDVRGRVVGGDGRENWARDFPPSSGWSPELMLVQGMKLMMGTAS